MLISYPGSIDFSTAFISSTSSSSLQGITFASLPSRVILENLSSICLIGCAIAVSKAERAVSWLSSSSNGSRNNFLKNFPLVAFSFAGGLLYGTSSLSKRVCKYNDGANNYIRSLDRLNELSDLHLGNSEDEENDVEEVPYSKPPCKREGN